ncbi:L,D-transpeptidase family protein [Paenibacillus baekrokdamisoli]|uniref:L,D-transpeptidase family protein n=1 Tax=Paenibacillus baekrokdamisoli TaxID=1712516 RepID=UPI001E3CCBAA|nr:L,D-transpeptidase family protein [Paenibacillus baekrokdamisoli]
MDAKDNNNDLIIINKKTNKLAYFSNGEMIKTFSVATGKKKQLTPEGTFKIANKIKNRPYYKDKIPGGDPHNPLGDRWLGLDVNGTKGTTYAIHGNNNERSIGKYVSAGCIRMKNDEIHWLFSQVKINTDVIITNSTLTLEHIAANHGYQIGQMKFEGKLLVNGVRKELDSDLLLSNSQVFIPLRECFEILGAKVEWSQLTGIVTATIGNRIITHKPLTSKAAVNGVSIAITTSRLQDDKVMLPLRNIAEITGYKVIWDAKGKTIQISDHGDEEVN